MAGSPQAARLLAVVAALSCMAVMIGVVKLATARSALKAELSKQHKIGSQIKAWVAASAMKSNRQGLKARFQQLMDDSSVPLPLEPEYHAVRHAFPARRRCRMFLFSLHPTASCRSSLKVLPGDDKSQDEVKGGHAELEAALEKAVRA
eukprot:753651-Hanusia_phi.AAC.4